MRGEPPWFINAYRSHLQGCLRRGHTPLTIADYRQLILEACRYCGTLPAGGVDRIDNSQTYELANSGPCCALCNGMKSNLDEQLFLLQCIRIASVVVPPEGGESSKALS